MGRDPRDDYQRDGGRYRSSGGPSSRGDRSPQRASGPGRPRASMSGRDDTPRGSRGYSGSGPANRPPNGGYNGGGNGRPPRGGSSADGGYDDGYSGRSRAPGRGPSGEMRRAPSTGERDGYDNSRTVPRPRRPSDPRDSGPQTGRNGRRDDGTGEGYSPRHSGNRPESHAQRTVGERFRDAARNMSRQLSSMMGAAGRAGRNMRREMSGSVQALMGPEFTPPAVAPGELGGPAYRRSRMRLLARKWRMRRVRGNPLSFAIAFAGMVMIGSMLAGAGGAGGVYAWSYYTANLGAIKSASIEGASQNTQIYDRSGQLLYAVQSKNGFQFNVQYSHISDLVKQATIDTEDRTFWSNGGIDVYRTMGALYDDLAHGGAAAQGGSTITQQLVKTLVLHNSEKALDRKIHEAILSIGITSTGEFSKQEILQMYLNNIFYGDQNTGIEAAAQSYFGYQEIDDKTTNALIKKANEQLTLPQIAVLVRLPNEPTNLQPNVWSCDAAPCPDTKWDPADKVGGGHETRVYNGAYIVLQSMVDAGHLSQPAADKALKEVHQMLVDETIYHWKGESEGNIHSQVTTKRAPHFVDYVIQQMISEFGYPDEKSLAAADLKIYTTLDYNLEKFIEDDANKYINGDPKDPNHGFLLRWYCPDSQGGYYHNSCWHGALSSPAYNVHNASAVAINPWTGDILAMMGSVDYASKDPKVLGFNNMAVLNRSMGSAFKPLVYATAFQKGWYPGIMLQDKPICYPGKQPPPPGAPPDWKPDVDPAAPACQGYYVPHNYDLTSFSGTAPARVMLANSLNIPATETQAFVGDNYAFSTDFMTMISRMGVHTCTDCPNMVSAARLGPTTALGTQEMPLIDLTTAYGTFAAEGQHTQPRAILRIDDNNDTTLWTAPKVKLEQVMSPQTAYMMTSILSDNQARAGDFKTENPLCFSCYPDGFVPGLPALNFGTPDTFTQYVAAKTGTSQGLTGPLDIVTVGFSQEMVLGVWAGNTDPHDSLNDIIGITGAGYIFHDAMAWAIKNYNWPAKAFPVPPQMDRGQFNCSTGLAPYAGTDPAVFSSNDANAPGNGWCKLSNTPSTDLYVGWMTGRQLKDVDWYIKGQLPDVS
jgi:membrane peptidoglycan carboxypeptidase